MGEILDGARLHGSTDLSADVVIVGSGASGAVTAAVLAEAGLEVLVLEEGPHVPESRYRSMRPSESLAAMWREGAMTAALGLGDSPTINVTMGRCVGGSSVLTGGVCFRTPEHVLHTWETRRGLTEYGPEALEPWFEQVERDIHVETVPESMRSRSTTLWGEGAKRAWGVELEPTRRNTEHCVGHGRCNFGCPKGAKRGVDVTYLPRALGKSTTVLSGALVERVRVEAGRATAVEGRLVDSQGKRGARFTARGARVVLAAGAAHTPLLLFRSGLARRSPHVGRHLTLHPSFRMIARFDEPVHGWRGALQSAYTDHFLESDGITLISVFVPPGAIASGLPGLGPAFMDRVGSLDHLAMFGGLIHDEGGGRVRPGIGREPIMTYRMAAQDRAALPKLVRKLGEAYFEAGARELYPPILGGHPVDADAFRALDLESIPARRFECSSQHPLGTCRMAPDPDSGVVGPDGKVFGVEGLYIVDGSILPTSLGVNPQLTIMALAMRLAARMV
jgi:choline dehydrogenase-like flavoprotein